MSEKKIKQQFKSAMQHKYAVGDRVRITNKEHKLYNFEGEITELMPYTFVEPAYYANISGMVVAVSERSIEKIEEIETPISESHS